MKRVPFLQLKKSASASRHVLCAIFTMLLMAFALNAHAQDDDDDPNLHLQVGYVNKQWVSDVDGRSYRENLWGREGHFLHGVQMGFLYTHPLNRFTGLYTGILYEAYFSTSKDMGYDDFTESNIYVPAHLSVNLPLSGSVAITMHGGLGLNCAIYGGFTNHDCWYWDYDIDGYPYRHHYDLEHIRYGSEGWPKRFNAQAEIALGLKVRHVVVSAGYSWGLTNHKFYKTVKGSGTHQNKMSLTVGLGF